MSATTSSLQTKGKLRRLSLSKALIGLTLGLLVLVVAVDLLLGHVLGLGNQLIMQPDAAAGYVLAPNQHLYRFFKHTDINGYGMRSPSFALKKPEGTYRVLVVGDSMANGGTQVDQAAIFSSLLAADLPAQLHKPVEVLNASTSAWAIANEAGYLASRGTYDADLVLLAINTGDSLQPPATLEDVGGDAATVKSPCAVCELWTRYLRDRLFGKQSKQDSGTLPGTNDMRNAAPNLQRLNHFRETAEQHHTPMAVVFMAMRQYVPAGATASAPPKLMEWGRQHGIPVIDTTSAESRFPSAEITRDGLHFNAKGHRVVATYLEQHWGEIDPRAEANIIAR